MGGAVTVSPACGLHPVQPPDLRRHLGIHVSQRAGGGRFNLVALNPLSVRTRDVDASAGVLPQPNESVISATLHWIPDDSGINPAMQARKR